MSGAGSVSLSGMIDDEKDLALLDSTPELNDVYRNLHAARTPTQLR